MALSSTIYKFTISLSDLNRDYYDTLNLTVAQHPSETPQRMLARVLAFCLHADEQLAFTKGLSTPESPDICSNSLDGRIQLWVEVGEPSVEKLKKASRLAEQVWVYSFNSKSGVWWQLEEPKMSSLPIRIRRFDWSEIESLSGLLERKVDCSITITEQSMYVASADQNHEIHWVELQH